MPLVVNLRHLAVRSLVLNGELPVGELDLDPRDEVIRVAAPLGYALEVEKLHEGLLVRGQLSLPLDCLCVRCFKPFTYRLAIDDFTCHVPLEGEDSAPVVHDCVDLTPHLREDILLELPQHPLCDPQCRGLAKKNIGKKKKSSPGPMKADSSAWAALDKLEL